MLQVATLSRLRRISSLMIEVNDHEKFLKDGMTLGNYGLDVDYVLLENYDDLYGPGDDDDVHLVLLEAAERLVATLRRL